ncbi:hypothetical protein [Aureivirga sp. CE67]|uniref:hypothetical protein n=1 Tax=Aureivirga sp. CE67 TaxID=1788983 RepID=UPI0018CB593F|nr:hypothetical protein [Aureivirga sp. CE67]
MKKSKAIELLNSDLKDIYDTLISISLYAYVSSSLFNTPNKKLSEEEIKVYNHLKKNEKRNTIYNSFMINLISIMESYLKNMLIEIILDDKSKSEKFVRKYKFERHLTSNDVVNGSEFLTISVLNDVIYHNLPKVNSLYKIITGIDILNIEGAEIKKIFKIIKLRHKMVHQANRINDRKIFLKELTLLHFITVISDWLLNIDCLILNGNLRKRTTNYTMKFYKDLGEKIELPILFNGKNEIEDNSLELLNDLLKDHKKEILI